MSAASVTGTRNQETTRRNFCVNNVKINTTELNMMIKTIGDKEKHTK